MRSPSPWVVRFAVRIREGGVVLDLAAGGGRHTRYLRELGHRVVAVDVDVSHMADLADDEAVELVEADLEHAEWPLSGRRFDAIVVTNYLHRPLLPVLAECLRPGGVLIYETFAEGNEKYGRPSNPSFLLREGELLEAFGGLTVIDYEHGYEARPRPAVRQKICASADPDAGADADTGADAGADTGTVAGAGADTDADAGTGTGTGYAPVSGRCVSSPRTPCPHMLRPPGRTRVVRALRSPLAE